MKKRILFVDDEPNVLHGLRRMLRGMRDEWGMEFTTSGEEALRILDERRFDVVITDIRMPGMDGVQLLTEIKSRYPEIVRIALSGQSSQQSILQSVGPTHQFLAKPCDADTLVGVIKRSSILHESLGNESLKQAVTRMESLPSLPSLYLELMEELKSKTSSLATIGKIISRDLGMTAKVLQLVNSAYFGLVRHVSNPVQAATLLGLDTIKALVLSVHVFSIIEGSQYEFLDLDRLWRHSYITGIMAKEIAAAEAATAADQDDAFMAGMLHDIGILVMCVNNPATYRQVVEAVRSKDNSTLSDAEKRFFSASHAKVGGYLLGLWGLPDNIVEAVFFHHAPGDCNNAEFSPLSAVHIANTFEPNRPALKHGSSPEKPDMEYVKRLGLAHRLPVWRDITINITKRGEGHE